MFDEYISVHGKRLFGLCQKLCKNREDAEDLYQETWIKAYKFFEIFFGVFLAFWNMVTCIGYLGRKFNDHCRILALISIIESNIIEGRLEAWTKNMLVIADSIAKTALLR